MAIRANCEGKTRTETEHLWQYDYGQSLLIEGVDLPDAYEVHFSNDPDSTSYTEIGTGEGVSIPDSLLTSGSDVYAWLYLHRGEGDGYTLIQIRIPVYKRSEPKDTAPTPVQQSEIDQAIAALQQAVATAEAVLQELQTYYAVFSINEDTGELEVTTTIGEES